MDPCSPQILTVGTTALCPAVKTFLSILSTRFAEIFKMAVIKME